MKGDKWARLGPEALKIVRDYQRLNSFKTLKEALERLLIENAHARMYIQYLLNRSDATKEDPECLRRFLYDGKYWCAKNAPKFHEIMTLEGCKACKLKVILNVTRPKEQAPLVSTGNRMTQETTNKKPEAPRYQWCPYGGGLIHDPKECDKCQHIECNHHPRTHTEREVS